MLFALLRPGRVAVGGLKPTLFMPTTMEPWEVGWEQPTLLAVYGAIVFVCVSAFEEAIIYKAAAQYQRASDAGISASDTERAAFKMIIRELETCTPGASRVRALGRNHLLWSTLVQDLSLAENQMPEGIKTQLISLGLWSMRYCTLALLKGLPVDPLVEVNRNVLDGLQAPAVAEDSQAQGNMLKAPISA